MHSVWESIECCRLKSRYRSMIYRRLYREGFPLKLNWKRMSVFHSVPVSIVFYFRATWGGGFSGVSDRVNCYISMIYRRCMEK